MPSKHHGPVRWQGLPGDPWSSHGPTSRGNPLSTGRIPLPCPQVTARGGLLAARAGTAGSVSYRPPSVVSLFTGIGVTVILVAGLVALRRANPAYLVIWSVALVAVIAFNVWAFIGSRHR